MTERARQAEQWYAVIYRPGAAWRTGRPVTEQPLGPHREFVRGLFDAGRLAIAGAFLDDGGGMTVFSARDQAEAKRTIASDPAVEGGVMIGELRPFYTVFERGRPTPLTDAAAREAPRRPAISTTSEHRAHIRWRQDGGSFTKRQYSRVHTWTFDGGITVPASASPSGVPVPYSDPANVDPEEAFVAAIASCHMLSFLFLAAGEGLEVRSYEDEAIGWMTPNERGVPWVSRVELRPRVEYADASPTSEREMELHHRAHDRCYIANSVRTEISVISPGGVSDRPSVLEQL